MPCRRYIAHRLTAAGGGADRVEFTAEALDLVYNASNGNPRLLNLIADKSLHRGYLDRTWTITPAIVTAALGDLGYAKPAPVPLSTTLRRLLPRRGVTSGAAAAGSDRRRSAFSAGRDPRRRCERCTAETAPRTPAPATRRAARDGRRGAGRDRLRAERVGSAAPAAGATASAAVVSARRRSLSAPAPLLSFRRRNSSRPSRRNIYSVGRAGARAIGEHHEPHRTTQGAG